MFSGSANPFNQGIGTVRTALPIQQFDLVKIGAIHRENGGQAKEYDLRALNQRTIGRSTRPISGYFLPWGSGKSYRGRLGINADFFFTPTRNGRTFVYSDNRPTAPVAHRNFADRATTLTDQRAITNSLTTSFGGPPPANRLIKTDYMRAPIGGEDDRATVIGTRTGSSWSFCDQNYQAESRGGGKTTHTRLDLCVPI